MGWKFIYVLNILILSNTKYYKTKYYLLSMLNVWVGYNLFIVNTCKNTCILNFENIKLQQVKKKTLAESNVFFVLEPELRKQLIGSKKCKKHCYRIY